MPSLPSLRSFFVAISCLFFTLSTQAQTSPSANKFFAARWYDRYQGISRIALVRQLQDRDWQAIDTTYGNPHKDGIRYMETTKIDLAPYVNDDGYIVYWVPEIAPQFPGGEKALQQYMSDVVFPHSAQLDRTSPNAIFIRCSIGIDGQITDVAEARPHPQWIPEEIAANCLDAVHYMPPWSPGLFHGKPVRVNKLLIFHLTE